MQDTTASIEDRIENVKEKFDNQIPVEDVSKVVSEVMGSIDGETPMDDLHVKDELKGLLNYIQQAKDEISALRPKEYGTNRIPEASNELDAIVSHTEKAAETVMDSADELGELAEKCDEEVSARLMDISTVLFEASGFQDITGQRINKVVTTLAHLEEKLSALAEAIGDADVDEKEEVADEDIFDKVDEMANEEFLNGPQLEGEAQDQAAIDALFDDF
ncbi:protein phosphatase CheZ [Pseudemcibacter aquimaris]|uniref:protein phosphatase CheZ n=1 Tax=Pseudemcibacter aquimaris TaxID=2857064 RepID=UPI002011E4EE|nr:protein phosphatase CheZ [Pseudemcibacter aquimaris]MCC3860818.1 protein phosphatase CheZ [Pseudemcibacter aquimaris]WDU59638.1 protein phosphatase CheZ [Pseudemcibacter aquimaris]